MRCMWEWTLSEPLYCGAGVWLHDFPGLLVTIVFVYTEQRGGGFS